MPTNIHITAVCPYFEVHEIIPQDKAVNRLIKIRKNYEWYDNNVNFSHIKGGGLKVITGVHNPELPFK